MAKPELRGRYCIAGVGEAPSVDLTDTDHWELNLIACKRAIEDAGIDKREIDVVITTGSMVVNRPRHHVVLCEQLGIPLARFTEMAAVGGRTRNRSVAVPQCRVRSTVLAHHGNALRLALQTLDARIQLDVRADGRGGGRRALPRVHASRREIPQTFDKRRRCSELPQDLFAVQASGLLQFQ